jgi:LacI family transcriptional regulator
MRDLSAMKASKQTRRTATLKDVAEAVGVNVSTVSRALNPESGHSISSELTDKIRKASRRLNYNRNSAAYSLRTRPSRIIGVVVPDITDPAFSPIIRGIEDGLSRHRYCAILANTDGNPRRQADVLQTMRSHAVDGLILASVMRRDDGISRLTAGIPVVTVSRQTNEPRFASVVHDESDAFRLVLTHLVSLGHRQIAAIAGPQTVSTGFNRYAGFVQHRKLLGLTPGSPLVAFARSFNEAEGERCAEELLIAENAFTAIVCANDRLAIGAITTLRRHGIKCPEQVSVTGFNDMPLADRLLPALTTVRAQHNRAGSEAAELMIDMLAGEPEPRHIVLPVELVVRDSTAAGSRKAQDGAVVGQAKARRGAGT